MLGLGSDTTSAKQCSTEVQLTYGLSAEPAFVKSQPTARTQTLVRLEVCEFTT
jgi:hypothetical protein